MLKSILIPAVIVFSGLAVAPPIDPNPDGMGFYFDTEGAEFCMTVDDWTPAIGAGPTITAYLLVTRPDTPFPTIQAWEAHIEIETNSFAPHPAAVYLTPGMADYNGDPDDWVVSNLPITITGDATMIARIEITWLGFEGHAQATILLDGVDGSLSFPDGPGYAAEAGFPTPCQPYHGNWGICAWINTTGLECGPDIANDAMTWGEVKGLY